VAVEEWEAELLHPAGASLGEGAVWIAETQELYWVDIERGELHALDPVRRRNRIVLVGDLISAVAPRCGGGLILAERRGFALLGDDGSAELVGPIANVPEMRMNDGACDSRGRFWAGSMHRRYELGTGTLFRFDPDRRVTPVLDGLTISNGIDWSPDDSTMYFIDSRTNAVDAFDFELDSGTIANRRHVACIPEEAGLPDGMTVDAEGFLWVCLWEGNAARRYTPEGELVGIVRVSAPRVTSCALGGPNLDVLFLTTATGSDADTPDAGGIFEARVDVRGVPTRCFAG
jgi:sugar lactone lactonase YvrE